MGEKATQHQQPLHQEQELESISSFNKCNSSVINTSGTCTVSSALPNDIADIPNGTNTKAPSTISLYVGDLNPNASETTIYDVFSKIGPVLSIRVCRDMITRKSLGYAYVNFQNHKDAETAIDALSFEPLMGRPMRIMWSQRDPTLRKSGVGNIFIKNLDRGITAKELNDTFSLFGKILSAKISIDENGLSRGYGFVHFEAEESANKAIENLNGKIVKGKTVYVGKFIPRNERGGKENATKFTNCYVKNFGENFKEEQIRELFDSFGEIVSAKIMEDESGKSKGFGFVCFKEPESAQAAVDAMNGKEIENRVIYVGRAQKKSEREMDLKNKYDAKLARPDRFNTGVNLYVKNLDEHIDDDQLKREFDQYGHITSVKVMTNAAGRSRGFGFVCFSSPEEASRAVTDLNGRIIGSKPLYVAVAQKKEERRVQLAHQQTNRLYSCYGAAPMPFASPLGAMNPNNLIRQQFGSTFPTAATMFQPQLSQLRTAAARWNLNSQSAAQAASFAQMRMNRASSSVMPSASGANGAQSAVLRAQNLASRPILGLQYNNSLGIAAQTTQGCMRGLGSQSSGQQSQQQNLYRNENISNQLMHQQMIRGPNSSDGWLSGLVNNGSANIRPGSTLYDSHTPPAGAQDMKKQMLGDVIYPIISDMYPAQAGKITGMLLELEESELKQLQSDPDALKRKVREANALIEQKRRLSDCPNNYMTNQGVAAGDLY